MKLLTLAIFIFSVSTYGFTPLADWTVCEGARCSNIKAGEDLYLEHTFSSQKAVYRTKFKKNEIRECSVKDDCWLYLGSVGDTITVKLNNGIIGKFDEYIHFESLKFYIPTNLLQDQNELILEIADLNQTRFGLRSPDVGIGLYSEVNQKSSIDWILRTGSPLLSAFTLFAVLIGLIAIYTGYRNPKILPIALLSCISILYLLSFSELPRKFFDPIYMSGPIHFVLRLALEMAVALVALSLYKPNQKIIFLNYLPSLYLIPILIMIGAGLAGIHNYSFYKTTMLIAAPLVVGGGLSLVLLASYFYGNQERRLVLPVFISLLVFQIYDLLIFWEVMVGSFTIKWYLPFLVICFSWIYIRRRIFEVRVLKIDALVGDEIRKLTHDLSAPIQNLKSLLRAGMILSDTRLAERNLADLENVALSVLGRYKNDEPPLENQSNQSLHFVINDLQNKFQDQINITYRLSAEFQWYAFDPILFNRSFTNLIKNSINAGASAFSISGVFANQHLEIYLEDNGSGVKCNLQPYIFEKGVTSNLITGNGLGLNFTKEKFTELGFHIDLYSSQKGKTIFCIRLPLKEIVLIDDNPLVRDTWKTLAIKAGIQFQSYSSGEDIKDGDFASKDTPIFVDYNLKDSSGIEVIKKIKNFGYNNVFLTTGHNEIIEQGIIQVGKEFPFIGKDLFT